MLRPKIPTNPIPAGRVMPPVLVEPTTVVPSAQVPPPTPIAPMQSRPTVQLTPGTALALAGSGTAAVLVVGAVLVSMLLAVAITSASVAVCALVIRSLVTADAKRR
ncbi:SpdD-like protein [Streptomyces sp. NPDC002225]|uniref:SpdD-like protein n=1 Tax=Streptomyces sp. NPDC002225 TaxID=3154413 RepID=UPI003332E7BC